MIDKGLKHKSSKRGYQKVGCYIWLHKNVSSLSPMPKTKLKDVWQTGKPMWKQTKWRADSLNLKRKISNYIDTNTDTQMCKRKHLNWHDWNEWCSRLGGGGEISAHIPSHENQIVTNFMGDISQEVS